MDRVLEAYNGGMGVEFMRKTRERMAWLCSHVQGSRVLDVGCSQGILPILLGRSGFVVQGLDINPEAIKYATNELKKELPSIQRSVTFSVGNFAQSEFSAQKYDTVIMGEVLEHLARPDIFISKAFEALQDKGLLLITVPFGINDDPDHRQTFYLSKMRELLCSFFLVKEERYFDGWIGFVAERRDARAEVVPVADIHDLVNVETAVFKRERRLLDRITDLQTKYKNQGDANLGLKNSVAKAESEIEKLAKANAELERAKSVVEDEVARQMEEVSKVAAERKRLAKANAWLERKNVDASKIEAEVSRLTKAYAELEKSKDEAESEIVQQKSEGVKVALEKEKLAKANAELERAKSEAEGEAARQKEEVARQKAEIAKVVSEKEKLAKANSELAKALANEKAWAAEHKKQFDQFLKETGSKRKELEDKLAQERLLRRDHDRLVKQHSRLEKLYKKLSEAKLGRLTLAYWRLKDGIKNRKKSAKSVGVSVVIPTYKEVPWLEEAVKSVLVQQSEQCQVQVLICVNGSDKDYFKRLCARYRNNANVEVLYTPSKGASEGRNIGIAAATKEYLCFLDSDDLLTPGYFTTLIKGFEDPDIDIVVGRLEEIESSGTPIKTSNYINVTLSKLGCGCIEKTRAASFFASFCMKIYRTSFVREKLVRLEEGHHHTEDVIFWARNFDKLPSKIYLSDAKSKEAYIRRRTEGSLSRPLAADEFSFYIKDRLAVLDELEKILLGTAHTEDHKEFVLSRIKAQTATMKRFFDTLHGEERRIAYEMISNSDNIFINKALFSSVEAIAFCHNFAPSIDASAFVATKRLREIDGLEDELLRWHVISQDMSRIRTEDSSFKKFYADFICADHYVEHASFGFAPAQQVAFADAAFETALKLPDAKVIYSRALFVGSHMAAYRYKKAHPSVIWYAEFSDPLSYGVDDKRRVCKGSPTWEDVEQMVYECADKIIFTNENELEYMLSYNPRQELNESIRKRAVILHHPVLSNKYCRIQECCYNLDENAINIAFFGTFYVTRGADSLLKLLLNPKVVLHVFTTKPEELQSQVAEYGDRIRINPVVSHLEVLNLASRMDYLYLDDTAFPGKINPFLPSKYADYLTSGTRIIAHVQPGSILSKATNPRVIKILDVNEKVARDLGKVPRN